MKLRATTSAVKDLCYAAATTALRDLHRSGGQPRTFRAPSHSLHSLVFRAVLSPYPYPDMHRFNRPVLWGHPTRAQSVFGGYVSLGVLAAVYDVLSLPGSSFSRAPVSFCESLKLSSFL